uniref:BTB/POZ domain-containing protein n=1 Tax=Knipowitschia caucasica TaxID=637954 RepID=A0AAV2LHP1_KNICA
MPKKAQAGCPGNASTAKTQVKMPDKKAAGTAAAATSTSNGTKPANGPLKKTLATTKPKTGVNSYPMASTAPKSGTSTSTKPDTSVTKTTRPATVLQTSRAAGKPTTVAATTKSLSTVSRTTAPRGATTAPPSGRTAAAPPNKVSGKKDVVRPPAAAVTKKPLHIPGAKKTDSKPAVCVRPSMTSTTTKVDQKLPPPLTKPQPTTMANATKKSSAAATRFRIAQTPPGSPMGKFPAARNAPQSKISHKPTQAVPPFGASKSTGKTGASKAAAATPKKTAGATGAVQDAQVPPQSSAPDSFADLVAPVSAQSIMLETAEKDAEIKISSASQSPLTTSSPQIEPCVPDPSAHELVQAAFHPSPVAASLPQELKNISSVTETQTLLLPKHTLEPENEQPLFVPFNNLNDDEEEEEKEGSQLVSVSEMSGTTQPTEESRPGSAGPLGASAWRVGGALHSELDSEEVSVSQQGASELSAPGVLEGTESMDDLGEGSLKGAMDMEGASAGSPDFERVPEIPVNDDDDDDDRVCDMDVGSERADEPQRHDNDVDDEDEDVEMASEGITESGLESYGNADEDDFAEDERLDNLNRMAQPPPPPLLPSAPAAQWDQPNPFSGPCAVLVPHQSPSEAAESGAQVEEAAESPLTDPCQGDSETPTQESGQVWMELGSATIINENQDDPETVFDKKPLTPEPAAEPALSQTALCALESSLSPIRSGPCSEETKVLSVEDVPEPRSSPQLEQSHGRAPDDTPACESSNGPASNPSSSSVTEDEASDTEGEAQLEDSLEPSIDCNVTFECMSHGQRMLSIVEEGEEPQDRGAPEDATPSATSLVSFGLDPTTLASNSNAQSTESCVKSPGIFSVEELPEEARELDFTHMHVASVSNQPYIECGKHPVDSEQAVESNIAIPDKVYSPSPEPQPVEQTAPLGDLQPPYYSAICEKTESFAGFTALLHPQRRDHSSYPRTYCDIVKPINAALASPRLSCTDLPPRSPKQQSLSPQLRRLEQHQRHLQELQQRREQQSRPMEEAEQERRTREEEEERKKKDEAEEEIKRNKRRLREQEELQQRKALEMQLQQQQEELKQRQQIMQWQQELEESNNEQPLLLSPSSGLCTIYEALEQDEDEAKCEDRVKGLNPIAEKDFKSSEVDSGCARVTPETQISPPPPQDAPQRLDCPTQNGDHDSSESPERESPRELEWGKKVDIVHQLINQTLLLNGDGCSSLLLLPGGAGGTLSPLESSLWPTLLPPLTPPSATVTSVSSFSPEITGTSPQGEWTVVELETHH